MDVFLMRWLMVLFAHEFTFEGSISFWDRVFTQKNKMKFICYISAAILVINKKKIDENGNGRNCGLGTRIRLDT